MFMLKDARKAKGMTMKELGEIIGVAESTISQYEAGKRQPDFEILLKLGETLNVSVDYLLGRDLTHLYTASNISNSSVAQGDGATANNHITSLGSIQDEYISVFNRLNIQGQIKTLSYMYELEEREK
jgi:transcriptional regulator with XRE-family HTH domain